MIELTVAIPMFRARYCGWIALESLIRQEDIDFEWELVIAEEINFNPFKKSRVLEYRRKLEDVGCVKINYFGLKHWERLSNKMVFMAKRSNKRSKIFASNAADLYSPPKRLKTQYDLFTAEPEKRPKNVNKMFTAPIDFYSNARTIVYDIKSGRYYLNDGLKKLERYRTHNITDGSCRSLRMDIMRNLPPLAHVAKSVDGWIWNKSKEWVERKGKKKFVHYLDLTSDNWKYCLNVNGLNNLTKNVRHLRATGSKRPFYIVDCPVDIKETIPSEILDRLEYSKKYVDRNDMSKPKWIPHKPPYNKV